MLGSPQLHPRHMFRSAEVILVLRFREPGAPTRPLARLAAARFGTVFLVSRVARVSSEQLPAKQAFGQLRTRHISTLPEADNAGAKRSPRRAPDGVLVERKTRKKKQKKL